MTTKQFYQLGAGVLSVSLLCLVIRFATNSSTDPANRALLESSTPDCCVDHEHPSLSRAKPPTQADELEQLLRAEKSPERDEGLQRLLQDWMARDPAAAARFALSIESPELRQDLMRRVLQLWAAEDSPAALAWAAQLPESSEREWALSHVCLCVAEDNARQAIRSAIEYHLEGDQSLMETLVTKWAGQDVTGAQAWVKQHSSAGQHDVLIARIAFVWSQTDPLAAARLAVEEIPPGDQQIEASIAVLHQWGLRNLPEARAWAESFPQGALRERALEELAAVARYLPPAQSP